ncbi:MAG TPA: A/G-specific adenine glycosylase [Burkholderiales bacterium]|nr:A/G-specific adenine glycosylase [Burkholderiales bacterium]
MSTGFSRKLIAWQKRHGRHDLPWQNTRDPYAIWVSEIMLQQTQVAAVIPYYQRFLRSFPDIPALAAASQDEVLTHWSGLGYYSRARNLHQAAQIMARDYGSRFPEDYEQVLALPGIGRSTAAAVCVFAFGARRAILDGNVKRVLARYFGIEGYPGEKRIEDDLWRQAETLLPRRDIEAYIQGLMDLGAGVCARRRPRCESCPLRDDCIAHRRGLTGRLPASKPKKTLPRKTTVMLVLQRAGEVLLEKRPATGIWGGLWCFPEMALGEDIEEICARRFGARVTRQEPLPVLEHSFTHFRLSITPQQLQVTALAARAAEPGHIWLPLGEAGTAAIPTPVRRILSGLRHDDYD